MAAAALSNQTTPSAVHTPQGAHTYPHPQLDRCRRIMCVQVHHHECMCIMMGLSNMHVGTYGSAGRLGGLSTLPLTSGSQRITKAAAASGTGTWSLQLCSLDFMLRFLASSISTRMNIRMIESCCVAARSQAADISRRLRSSG